MLVGPFSTESEANATAAKIRQAGYGVDPVIYRFKGDGSAASTSASAGTATSTSATPASTTSAAGGAATAVPTTSSGGRYIQAGAYATSASAQPQRNRLEGLGFRVTARTENGLVKLLIGPFDAQHLQEAKAQLDAAGIESFVR